MFAHLVVDLLIARIGLGADARLFQRVDHLVHIAIGIRHDGGHDHLTRGQPEGELTGVVFDQDADKALERPKDRAVQHDGTVFRAVFADEFRIQTVRQVEIGLESAALPFAADRVGQLEIKLRAIERAVTFVDLVGKTQTFDGLLQRAFGLVPNLIAAHAHIGAGGEFDVELFKA